jgi:hypothetical protein
MQAKIKELADPKRQQHKMIDPTERIHKKKPPDPKIILKSIDLLGRYQETKPIRHKKSQSSDPD